MSINDGRRELEQLNARPRRGSVSAVTIAKRGDYSRAELDALIARENRNVFDILVAQLRSAVGVVPFVGAGLSIPLGFPGWPAFLRDAAASHRTPERVLDLVRQNELIKAASLLEKPDRDRFQRLVEKWFGAPVTDDQVRSGPISLLPLLCKGPSITTNFDRVLETAFRVAGQKFDRPITSREPDNVIRAMHRNEHVLIKLHGDALDRSARVFTGLEYRREYGKARGNGPLPGSGIPMLARIMFTNRPLLFLGCSLERDRTLDVLARLHLELPGVTHFAVVAADTSKATLRRRRDELGEYGILPIWFAPGDFGRIETILEDLLRETSTRLLWRPPGPPAPSPITVTTRRTRRAPRLKGAALPEPVRRLTRRIAERLVRGDLAFFLGAAVHLDRLPSARDFYASLSRDYGIEDEGLDRAQVAQYLIDREGKAQAWAAAKQKLSLPGGRRGRPDPGVVCRFLADLPATLRDHGRRSVAEQWYLTANYDIVMEEELARRGERFHLLSHQVDGDDGGRFAHRDLDGAIRVIERPENIRSLSTEPATVLVKLDGGVSWDPKMPETVAISPLDFSIASGRLLTALPRAVRDVLRTRSLLVLGSSLRDAHIQRVVRWSAGNSREMKTWAVMKGPPPALAQFWAAAGVDIVDCDLEDFTPELEAQLLSLLRPS